MTYRRYDADADDADADADAIPIQAPEHCGAMKKCVGFIS